MSEIHFFSRAFGGKLKVHADILAERCVKLSLACRVENAYTKNASLSFSEITVTICEHEMITEIEGNQASVREKSGGNE